MFDITFLGASGGPIEGLNCSILIKPSEVEYDKLDDNSNKDMIMIDAGSGVRRLAEIIRCSGTDSGESSKDLIHIECPYYKDSLSVKEAMSAATVINPFTTLTNNPYKNAWDIINSMTSYLISHPHLDHVNGIAINSAGFDPYRNNKIIYGSSYTIGALQKHIFNGIIWPNMPGLGILELQEKEYWSMFTVGNYNVTMFDISHGKVYNGKKSNNESNSDLSFLNRKGNSGSPFTHDDTYLSSAFLLEYTPSKTKDEITPSILIFGDFEADSMSGQSKNARIWQKIAPRVTNKSLRAMVMECSSCSHQEDNLYGHLMPKHLIDEMLALEAECKRYENRENEIYSPLEGFHILVNHVKESWGGFCPKRKILETLNELNSRHKLGLRISIALSGVSVRV